MTSRHVQPHYSLLLYNRLSNLGPRTSIQLYTTGAALKLNCPRVCGLWRGHGTACESACVCLAPFEPQSVMRCFDLRAERAVASRGSELHGARWLRRWL